MSTLKIISNHHPRATFYWHDLTPKEQREFDWIKRPEESGETFFRYRGQVYCLSEFMLASGEIAKRGWEGYSSDSYFSGVVVKDCEMDDGPGIIIGRYFS